MRNFKNETRHNLQLKRFKDLEKKTLFHKFAFRFFHVEFSKVPYSYNNLNSIFRVSEKEEPSRSLQIDISYWFNFKKFKEMVDKDESWRLSFWNIVSECLSFSFVADKDEKIFSGWMETYKGLNFGWFEQNPYFIYKRDDEISVCLLTDEEILPKRTSDKINRLLDMESKDPTIKWAQDKFLGHLQLGEPEWRRKHLYNFLDGRCSKSVEFIHFLSSKNNQPLHNYDILDQSIKEKFNGHISYLNFLEHIFVVGHSGQLRIFFCEGEMLYTDVGEYNLDVFDNPEKRFMAKRLENVKVLSDIAGNIIGIKR